MEFVRGLMSGAERLQEEGNEVLVEERHEEEEREQEEEQEEQEGSAETRRGPRARHREEEEDVEQGDVQLRNTERWSSQQCFQFKREYCYVFLIAVLFVAVIVLGANYSRKEPKKEELKTCMSDVCVSAATQMLTYMDPSVPPCGDFYRYACGRWGARYPPPGGKKRWSVWDISFHHNLELIKNRLENGTFVKRENLAAYDAQAFYLACMDEERVEDVGATPLLELLKEFGGWGVLGNSSHLHLTELMTHLSRKFLSPALFDIDVVPGIDSPEMFYIKLSTPKLSLPSLYYSNNPVNKILPAYKEYMMRVTRLLGGGNSSCAEMEKVLAFEQDLAEIIPDSKVEGSVNRTINELQFGGWGVLGNSSHLHLTELMTHLSRKFLSPALFDIDVVPGIDSPEMFYIKLSTPKLSLPSLYYSNNPVNKILPAYKEYMMRVTRLLGGGNSSCAEMEKVLAFEQDLAEIIPDSKVEGSVNRTINELQKEFPFLNWTLYLSGLFSNGTYENQPLIIDSIPYFQKLSDYVKKSDPKTLTNYALWMLIQKMIPSLDYRFRKAALIMAEAIDETTEPVRRWEFCMDLADKSLAYALGEIFAMKEITAKRKDDVKNMIKNMKDAFKDNLDHLPWMDNKTRLAAKEKAKNIQSAVGEDDYMEDVSNVDDIYQDFKVVEGRFFETMVNFYNYTSIRTIRTMWTGKMKWRAPPQTVDAFYYYESLNTMYIPAGIMQEPFYQDVYPTFLKYAGIGTVIGT
ncbi:endothelin-converting enzyme 2-like [Lethenteron reissneri]|uniref:endothelin-converting enzyme 2-like n=1 Tax=Lethenteron reissneri TaxID=7753 RepID=UPI002AB71175|nr:endothelin-converting enzyme 2-like [Lethenteron reissneri]